MRVFPFVAALVCAFSAVTACGPSCGDMGCIPGVTVQFASVMSAPGAYEVDFVGDGTTFTCTVTLPSTVLAKCSDERAYVFQAPNGDLQGVSLDGMFRSLSVTVQKDGVTISEGSFQPAYQGVENNAPGCGTCPQASETLATS